MKLFYLFIVLLLIGVSACYLDTGSNYRWSVKTLTDPIGDSLLKFSPVKSSITNLLSEKRTCPDFEKDQNIRYPNEKRLVSVDAVLLKIKIGSDRDFHLVLKSAEGTLMVAEIPDGDGSAYDHHPDLRKHFNEMRLQIIKVVGFIPEEEFRDVNKSVTVEGIPFWDKIKVGHNPKYGSVDKHEIHPVTQIIFN